MTDYAATNRQIIDEFRTNEGRMGGRFENAPLLLLHTTGAKSGAERINPMMYLPIGNAFAVFASKGGAPTNPDWYHNLIANPSVSIEVGTERVDVVARVVHGIEREEIWSRQKELYPQFAEYETKTTREIPVIVLERAG